MRASCWLFDDALAQLPLGVGRRCGSVVAAGPSLRVSRRCGSAVAGVLSLWLAPRTSDGQRAARLRDNPARRGVLHATVRRVVSKRRTRSRGAHAMVKRRAFLAVKASSIKWRWYGPVAMLRALAQKKQRAEEQ